MLINLSFSVGKFPTILKLGQILPFHERDDKSNCNNYRPISLISNLSKIIEKIVYSRLYLFFEQKELLYSRQFGFRNNHSTTDALIDITEKIRKASDNKLYSCGVFLDLQKAFDTVNHNILLQKLAYYGVRSLANNWFRTFISQRVQFTSINKTNSDSHLITHGVPQGSVLGPLLFLIFINDLHKAIKNSDLQLHLFADDTNLLYSNKSLKKINKHTNQDLSFLSKWLRSNKISLNTSKTEIIIFRPKRKIIQKHPNFRISRQQIKTNTHVKYLGIHLDQHLDWNLNMTTLQSKLNRAIGLISKIRHYVPKFLLRTLYFTLFNSYLIYACQVWGQDPLYLRRLCILQNKALRIINFKEYDYPTNDLYHESKILKIEDYIKLLNCFFVKDVLEKTSIKNIYHIPTIN